MIGVDASPSMIEKAREQLGDDVELIVANLLDLELAEPVDAILSGATFHWVLDHDRLFARLHAAMKPGAALEAQCGGQGNIAEFEGALLGLEGDERFSPYLRTLQSPWNFASVAVTESRLERAGFGEVRCWLEDAPTVPEDPRAFLASSVIPVHLECLPEELRRLLPGRDPRVDPASADLELRPPQHLRQEDLKPMSHRVVVLPGDGIGPEIVAAAERVLDALGGVETEERIVGGASIDAHGTALTDEVLEDCRQADAVLLGAVGGPKWDTTDPDAPRPEQGLLGLRKGLGLYANLRPVRPSPSLVSASPLREERIAGTDLLVVRELTGGIYFGESGRDGDTAHDDCLYTVAEIERIARVAFAAARRRAIGGDGPPRVTSVDKANVLETSRLWRETVTRVAEEYDDVELDHMLVDNTAMQLVAAPSRFDVIVTENMFGDILSDESAMLTGSLGMLPSASLGADGPGVFEPVHGSAPDIAGEGVANPLATFLSTAMLLRDGLDRPDDAAAIEHAVEDALGRGLRTPDLASGDDTDYVVEVGTEEMTDAVLEALAP